VFWLCMHGSPPPLPPTHQTTHPPPPPVLQGPYDTPEGFKALSSRLDELEAHKPQANRMFFLSIPPNVFLPATGNAADYARSRCGGGCDNPNQNMSHIYALTQMCHTMHFHHTGQLRLPSQPCSIACNQDRCHTSFRTCCMSACCACGPPPPCVGLGGRV
jgi:hypothetical protein